MTNRLQDSRGRLSLALAVFLLLISCRPKPPRPDKGKVEDGVYKSQYFNLVLPVPAGWEAESPPSGMSRFLQYYLEALAAKDEPTGLETRVIPMVRMTSAPIKTMGKDDAVVTLAAAEPTRRRPRGARPDARSTRPDVPDAIAPGGAGTPDRRARL